MSTLSVRFRLAVGDGRGSLHSAAATINDGVAASSDTRGHTRRVSKSRGRESERMFLAVVRRAASTAASVHGGRRQLRH